MPIVSSFEMVKPTLKVQDSYYSFVRQTDKSKSAIKKSLEKLKLLKKH